MVKIKKKNLKTISDIFNNYDDIKIMEIVDRYFERRLDTKPRLLNLSLFTYIKQNI